MAIINNKTEATSGPNGVVLAIPTNTSNLIKAVNFHTYLGNLIEWMFPTVAPPIGASLTQTSSDFGLGWEIMMPVGAVIPYTSDVAPDGWLLCDGTVYTIASYPELFAVVNGDYDTTANAGEFNVPDLRARVPVGTGTLGVIASGETFSPTYSLGDYSGINQYIFDINEMPSHNHFFSTATDIDGNHSHTHKGFRYVGTTGTLKEVKSRELFPGDPVDYGGEASGSHQHNISGNTNSTGSGVSHENRMPYLAMNYIIKK